jgi:hypothetical protein
MEGVVFITPFFEVIWVYLLPYWFVRDLLTADLPAVNTCSSHKKGDISLDQACPFQHYKHIS